MPSETSYSLVVVPSDCACYSEDLVAAEWASMPAEMAGADETVESRSDVELDLSFGASR